MEAHAVHAACPHSSLHPLILFKNSYMQLFLKHMLYMLHVHIPDYMNTFSLKTFLTWEREARLFFEVYDIEYLRISKRGHDLLTGEDLARIVRTRSKSFRKSSNIQAWARPIEWGVPGQQQQHQQQHQHQQQRAYRRYVCCRLRPARFWLIFGSTLDPFRDQFQITS